MWRRTYYQFERQLIEHVEEEKMQVKIHLVIKAIIIIQYFNVLMWKFQKKKKKKIWDKMGVESFWWFVVATHEHNITQNQARQDTTYKCTQVQVEYSTEMSSLRWSLISSLRWALNRPQVSGTR